MLLRVTTSTTLFSLFRTEMYLKITKIRQSVLEYMSQNLINPKNKISAMKVYFACSMRGGYQNTGLVNLKKLTDILQEAGFDVLTTHTTEDGSIEKEKSLDTTHIYERDYRWIKECDFMVAEISNPSLGVGSEISDAITLKKPVITMFSIDELKVSAYILGKLKKTENCRYSKYDNENDFIEIIKEFSKTVSLKE